jgi:hypothetical protein
MEELFDLLPYEDDDAAPEQECELIEDKLTAEQLRQAVHTNNFEKLEYIKTFCCCQKIY